MIRPVPAIAAMAPYAVSDPGPAGALRLNQNESAFGPSPSALEAGRMALATAALYPDPAWRDLRAAIAETHGLDPGQILCGAGSMELIGALIRAYAGSGDVVLGSAHGYLFVATACAQAGAIYRTAPERAYTASVDALLEAITAETRLVFLCNPANPTGTRVLSGEVLRLRAEMPPDALLVIDQAYAEFDDQEARPLFALAERGDTVILRTFSKAYALASARVGWGLFPTAIGQEMRKLLNPNNIPAVSQALAAAAMRDTAHMAEITHRTAEIRDVFRARLTAAGWAVPESWTNFVLIPFASAQAAGAADAALRQAGVVLRGMAGYGLGHCLRATIGPPSDMERLADTLIAIRECTP
ncbi:MAG: histidinol-phosphate transaminase [Pseudomonadota bacterium]